MPIYQYQCKSCDHTFDLLLPVSKREIQLASKCPSCGKKKVERQFDGCAPVTGSNANVTPEKCCPGFTQRMEKIAKSRSSDARARKNIQASLNMKGNPLSRS